MYREARTSDLFTVPNIERGRSRSVSSELEDLVAAEIFRHISKCGKKIKIFIDQPISIKGYGKNGKSKSTYPDVIVCRETETKYECIYLCDVKTDPGWNRNGLNELVKKHNEELVALKSFNFNMKSGTSRKELYKEITFETCDCYDIVYISSKNGSKKFQEDKNAINNLSIDSNRVFSLTDKYHPNGYDEAKPPILSPEFTEWIDRIKSKVN